ncbi:MAG TPA: hypothetical protein VEQ85_11125, partial [Lacipirellulaceae bacterium]|nr:hypothetical protein [Lacipirellulaceae bacterium]
IIAQGAWTSQVTGGIRQDGKVAMVAYEPLVFEGGRYEGASFTTAADALSARGGNAIHVYTSSNPTIWIHEGTFRGGSVFLDSLSQPIDTATGADAIFLNSRNGSRLIIYDGLIEGGVVALKDAPNEPLQRGYAIQTGGWRERSRHLIDVHGGDLVGGVNMYGHARFTVYGSEIAISPALDGLFSGPTNFTITGLYADGTPFSHAVRADPFAYGRIDRNGGSLAIELLVPEPSGLMAITTAAAALCVIRRRAPKKPAMASPLRQKPGNDIAAPTAAGTFSHSTAPGAGPHAFLASPRLGVQ